MTSVELAVEHLRMTVLSGDATDARQAVVMVSDLAALLADYDRLADEPPSPPDTGKLCCCHTGTDCPACLTGRCSQCPDNPERERDDDWGDEEGWWDDDD